MTGWLQHLIILPILLPLFVSALMLFFDERRRILKRVLSLSTAGALIVISVTLLWFVSYPQAGSEGPPYVYLLGDWSAPFGIVLVADRLSILMLLLTSVLGFTSLFYAQARWDRSGPRFHPMFLLLLMGVNGAFLTGDIFNLFVFFEVLLAASYGLILHGSGAERTSASLHYVALNIVTAFLFLIGVAMIYSATGTLNMGDLAIKVTQVPAEDLMLLESGAAILGTAFLVKAGIWPLSFWLPRTYAAAAAPIAALFAIMTKVGIYIILRLSSLLFGAGAGGAAGFANDWLVYAGFATIVFGTTGILGSRRLTGIVGHYVLVSSGTLIATLGMGSTALHAALLFYLVSSTLAVSALYMIIEPVERNAEEDEFEEGISEPVFDDEYIGAIEEEENEIGVSIPGTIAILGGGFIFCALLLSGMPPLSGFIAKFAIIDALFRGDMVTTEGWVLISLLIISGLATLIAMTRAGIDLLWTPTDVTPPRLHVIEVAPIGLLLSVCLALMIGAGPTMRYLEKTAATLDDPIGYIQAVASAPRASIRKEAAARARTLNQAESETETGAETEEGGQID